MNNDHHLNDYCAADRRLAQMQEETSAQIARRFAHRWPEILTYGAVVATCILAVTGWL